MGLIASFRRNRAIKLYIKKLPKLLAKDYGKASTYNPKQIKRTIERGGLPVADACFGMAIFSAKTGFDKYHEETGESCDYDAMRCEIADKHFNGNSDFEISGIAAVSSSYGGGFDDGGFGGGGDGGSSD